METRNRRMLTVIWVLGLQAMAHCLTGQSLVLFVVRNGFTAVYMGQLWLKGGESIGFVVRLSTLNRTEPWVNGSSSGRTREFNNKTFINK